MTLGYTATLEQWQLRTTHICVCISCIRQSQDLIQVCHGGTHWIGWCHTLNHTLNLWWVIRTTQNCYGCSCTRRKQLHLEETEVHHFWPEVMRECNARTSTFRRLGSAVIPRFPTAAQLKCNSMGDRVDGASEPPTAPPLESKLGLRTVAPLPDGGQQCDWLPRTTIATCTITPLIFTVYFGEHFRVTDCCSNF